MKHYGRDGVLFALRTKAGRREVDTSRWMDKIGRFFFLEPINSRQPVKNL